MQPFGQNAKENLQKGGKISQQGSQISVKAINTQKELAKQANVSHDTISKVEAQAKSQKRGMWSQGDKYVSPKDWRKMNK